MIYDTLLITGCEGDIGLALADIVADTGAASRVVGCDVHAARGASPLFAARETVPFADAPDYLSRLRQLTNQHDVDAIVPMSEAEIASLARAGSLETFAGRAVIAANRLAVDTGLDKLETYRMLRRAGLPAPWTIAVKDGEPISLPCIVKPRRGQGGKGLRRVSTAAEAKIAAVNQDYIWQELILPDEPEYTCGLYRAASGEIRTIIFARQLRGGITHSAELVENDAIDALLCEIARAVELKGAINVQLRVDSEGPKVFEINPRFSSTVGFRHRLGFRDFIWSLRERKGLAIDPYAPAPAGTRIVRGTPLQVMQP